MTWEDKIYKWLDELKPGCSIKIINVCRSENQEKFIELVKEYIDNHHYGNGIEFSNDYSQIKKIETPC